MSPFADWAHVMHITTWNVNSLKVRLPQVQAWLAQHQPDILGLQELKLDQDQFPHPALTELGYHSVWYGQKTYNGVALISKQVATDVVLGLPEWDDPQRRVISASYGDLRVINAYCVNGEAVGSEKFAYKERWYAALYAFVKQQLQHYPQLVLMGDFNIAPADADVYDPKQWHEKILCSTPERQWFQSLLSLGLTDSLRHIHPEASIYTWWDYRMNMFKRKLGLRIDHLLVSQPLHAAITAVQVDTEARAAERPSDHAPVSLILNLNSPA